MAGGLPKKGRKLFRTKASVGLGVLFFVVLSQHAGADEPVRPGGPVDFRRLEDLKPYRAH